MAYWIGAGGAVAFVLVFLVEGLTRPGYGPVRHPVSALALGPRGWVQTTNFLVCGVAITFGAITVAFAARHLFMGITLMVFGLGLVASGVFRMDPMRGYPPGTPHDDPANFTVWHKLHDYAGAVVFSSAPISAAVAVFVLPTVAGKILAAIATVALTTGSVAFGIAWENDSPRTGLVQRAFIIPAWLWVAAIFVHFA